MKLLRGGDAPSAGSSPDRLAGTATRTAAEIGNDERLVMDELGMTPLMSACQQEAEKDVRILLGYKVSIVYYIVIYR